MRVMVPPIGNDVVAAKPKVTGTEVRLATRSFEAIENETNVTLVSMAPDDTATLDEVSADVVMNTPTLPAVAPPIVKPDIVIVTKENVIAVPAGIVAPAVVRTNDVAELVLEVNVNPDTSL